MPTRNVVLTDHQSAMVDQLVQSGRYQNASEVLRNGLRLIEERDAEHHAKLAALRQAVQVGIDDTAAGRYEDFATPEELRRHLTEITDSIITEMAELWSRKRLSPAQGNRVKECGPEEWNVIPAKAGIQGVHIQSFRDPWIPAFAGMTTKNLPRDVIRSAINDYCPSPDCPGHRPAPSCLPLHPRVGDGPSQRRWDQK